MKFSIRFIMGYYASGDTRKTMHSSEDDEGYENRSIISYDATWQVIISIRY